MLARNLRSSSSWGTLIRTASTQEPAIDIQEEEFRVLTLRSQQQHKKLRRRGFRKGDVKPARTNKMPINQDWTSVWPGPRSFHPASVPIPIRQGLTVNGTAPPSKYANSELMKIPNFLHLTPPTVRQQCEAIKKFCTSWPKGLETEANYKRHFPIEIITTDYCHALPTIRQPEARRVTLKLKLRDLKFDAHARDKFLRLVGERYDRKTEFFTIVADRCPLRRQNLDYALYLLTACYYESFQTEPWEALKSEADMEYYRFECNKSKSSMEAILNWGKSEAASKLIASKSFERSVEQLINDGENEYNLTKYKEAVVQMLGLHTKKD